MKIFPNREIFVSAREAEDCTQTDLAVAAQVSQGVISNVERGLGGITEEQLQRIADFLGYDVSLFTAPDRIRSGASACLYHMKRKTLPKRVLQRLEGRMFMATLHVDRLLSDFEVDSERVFHRMDLEDYDSPSEVARALRRAWRIEPGPIGNLMALIESAGAVVLMDDFRHRKLFGMSCWSKTLRPLFFLNSAMPTEELRWTLAHELGHLTMHSYAPAGDPEEQADEFAGEFLMPKAEVLPQLRNLTFRQLPALKSYWRVSMKAVIRRAQKVGAISNSAAETLYKQYNYRRYASGEPFQLREEKPYLVEQALKLHFEEHGYAVNQIAAVAGLSEDKLVERFMGSLTPRRQGNVIRLNPA